VLDRAAAENLNERAAKSAKRRANESSDENENRRLADASEPGRFETQLLQGEGVEHGHRAIGGKGDQQLCCRHFDLQLRCHVGRQGGKNVNPPVSRSTQQQRAKQDDIGRPEWRENLVGERADEKRNFGADIITNRNDQTVANNLRPVFAWRTLPLLDRGLRNENIHRPPLDHNNFMRSDYSQTKQPKTL